MRSHEERIEEVKQRIVEKECQKRLRRGRIAAVSGVAACLAVIVGVSPVSYTHLVLVLHITICCGILVLCKTNCRVKCPHRRGKGNQV